MKPSYSGFEAKKDPGFLTLPPVGCYKAEIKNVHIIELFDNEYIEMMLDITDGEYANRFTEVWKNNQERFGDNVKYKGLFRLRIPKDGDEDWVKRSFESNLWAVEDSNSGYHWDWDEKKLKGKKVGINVRDYLYTYNEKDRQTTEIGRFESIKDIDAGKVKPMKARDKREKNDSGDVPASTDGNNFTDVSEDVQVPW